MQTLKNSTRTYVSPARTAAAAVRRQEIIAAATRLLRKKAGIASFSLAAVAKGAGITRLTVYHQFGSRRGLLEAVIDDIAARGNLTRLSDAVHHPDPLGGLDSFIEILCGFWSFEPAVGRLEDATATDREFARAVFNRTERRRPMIRSIVRRIHPDQSAIRERDMVDFIFSLTTYATFSSLSNERKPAAVGILIKRACRGVIDVPDKE